MEFGGNEQNMGLDRNFGQDGTGNHGISGITTIPSELETGLIDSSFVLKQRLARTEIGGLDSLELNMGLARNCSLVYVGNWDSSGLCGTLGFK